MKTGFIFSILFAGLATLSACGGGSEAPALPASAAAFGSASVELKAGQSEPLTATNTLTLERIDDSRCRAGVTCIWAGAISYHFTLSGANPIEQFVLSDTLPGAANAATRQGLTFTLVGVTPDAVPAADAPTPDYRVALRVNSAAN